jgi:ABC-type protease/lipase transport system fused ATPase/permease subunit
MILRFPQGYDMPMGQAGGTLSGGQRQRIGLARALYDEPALILLDEPDANLDDAGEAALVKAIGMLKEKGKTVLVVTHRGPLVKLADRVIHMNQGRIQAFGPVNKVFGRIAQSGPATEMLLENHP